MESGPSIHLGGLRDRVNSKNNLRQVRPLSLSKGAPIGIQGSPKRSVFRSGAPFLKPCTELFATFLREKSRGEKVEEKKFLPFFYLDTKNPPTFSTHPSI
jgi:hypothetical protein